MFIFLKFEFFGTLTPEPFGESFRENLLIKSRNQNIFEKFKLNRDLQIIPFKIMYNMFMLRHWFSNERWGAAPEPPSSLRPRLHEIVFGDSETKYPRLHDRFHIVFPVYTNPPESPKTQWEIYWAHTAHVRRRASHVA